MVKETGTKKLGTDGTFTNFHSLNKPPQPFKLLLLRNSQRLSLKFEGDIADFIQEESAFICQLETVDFTGDCAGECSLFVAEEFTLQQAERNRCAVEPHEMAVVPWTEVVNRASDQFFAGSCGNSNPQSNPQTFWWRVRYSLGSASSVYVPAMPLFCRILTTTRRFSA